MYSCETAKVAIQTFVFCIQKETNISFRSVIMISIYWTKLAATNMPYVCFDLLCSLWITACQFVWNCMRLTCNYTYNHHLWGWRRMYCHHCLTWAEMFVCKNTNEETYHAYGSVGVYVPQNTQHKFLLFVNPVISFWGTDCQPLFLKKVFFHCQFMSTCLLLEKKKKIVLLVLVRFRCFKIL